MTSMVHPDPYSIGNALAEGYNSNGASGAAKTLDFAGGATQEVQLTASGPTITLKNASADAGKVRRIRIILTQDGTGSRTLPTFSPALNYGTPGAPTLSTAAGKKDVLDVLVQGSNYFCINRTLGF